MIQSVELTCQCSADDAGHMELTGSRTWDYYIGGFIASWMSGLSLGWWVSQHDVHHSELSVAAEKPSPS